MAYRNKTYVAFASEDILSYRMMEAWRENQHIDFDFFDAHDLYVARDTSTDESIRDRLRQRLNNAKQVVVLISTTTKPKAARSNSFLHYEIETIARLNLPVVFANIDGYRGVRTSLLPTTLATPYYTVSVSFQPKIIQYALDNYVAAFVNNTGPNAVTGSHLYNAKAYSDLGL